MAGRARPKTRPEVASHPGSLRGFGDKGVIRRGATCSATLVLTLALLVAAAYGASLPKHDLGGGHHVGLFISDRARAEIVNWFDPGGGANDDYVFFANVIRFGTDLDGERLHLRIEGQEVELIHLPDDASGLGPGQVYFANTRDRDQREVHLRQGFLELKDVAPGLSLMAGRSIFNDGLEQAASDSSLAWIKKKRISQRLLGGFDYTHVGRSFDGGTLVLDHGPYNLTLMGGLPTAGGFNINANKHIEDIWVAYAAATVTEPDWLPRSDLRVFYLLYSDDRDVVFTDPRPLPDRQADPEDIFIQTLGVNFTEVVRLGPGDLDAMLWAAGQVGDWGVLDHNAYAFAAEIGYRWVEERGKPWLRIGYNYASGDDDPADRDHGTFFQALPTARLYARTPFFNMMNNQDAFAQLILNPCKGMVIRGDYHYLRVAEDDDLVYAGGGATQAAPIFGYAGFPAGGDNEIGHFADVSVNYTFTENFSAELYYGRVFGGTIIENRFTAGETLNYAYVQGTVSF